MSDFRVGDPVFAVCEVGQEGTYAEKIAIKASIVPRAPGISHVDAAALALAGLTALVAVEDTLKLKRGRDHPDPGRRRRRREFAIELAKHIGARVISTASAANVDHVKNSAPIR